MSLRRPAALLAALVPSIACILQLSACKDDGTHVYQGRLYLEARGCLGTPSAVDVVEGDVPGDCEPICLRQIRAEGGRAVYVSASCPPYPGPDFDRSGTDPACPAALAALARGDTCLTDGGSTHPIPIADAAVNDAAAD